MSSVYLDELPMNSPRKLSLSLAYGEASNSKTLYKLRGMSKSFHHKGIDFSLYVVGIEKIYSKFLKAAWFSFSTACQGIN